MKAGNENRYIDSVFDLWELWMNTAAMAIKTGIDTQMVTPNTNSVAGIIDDDRVDIEASINGNGEAYARLVGRYEHLISQQMWRFTRDREQLEHLVQDVFVEAYYSLHGYKWKAPFLHWIRRIATRVGYRFWKERSRDTQYLDYGKESHIDSYPTPETQTPSEAAEYLYSILSDLPPDDRIVLTLLYFEECSTKEIAERLKWSQSLVKVRAFRARKKLKKKLEHAGYGRNNHE